MRVMRSVVLVLLAAVIVSAVQEHRSHAHRRDELAMLREKLEPMSCAQKRDELAWQRDERVCPPSGYCQIERDNIVEVLTSELEGACDPLNSNDENPAYLDYPPHSTPCIRLDCGGIRPNTMVFGDFIGRNANTEGEIYVGGDATLRHYSIGTALPQMFFNNFSRPTFVVGGTALFHDGTNANGNIIFGEGEDLDDSVRHSMGGFFVKHNPDFFDFAGCEECYQSLSAQLRDIPSTGDVVIRNSQLNFNHQYNFNPQVFDITCETLATSPTADFRKLDVGEAVVVNVAGKTGCQFPQDVIVDNPHLVVWNFHEAEEVLLNSRVPGSVLAPYAHAKAQHGDIEGQVIFKSWEGATHQIWSLYQGCLPAPGDNPMIY